MQKRGFCGAESGLHWSLAARNNYFSKAHWRGAQRTYDFAVLHDWIARKGQKKGSAMLCLQFPILPTTFPL